MDHCSFLNQYHFDDRSLGYVESRASACLLIAGQAFTRNCGEMEIWQDVIEELTDVQLQSNHPQAMTGSARIRNAWCG